VPHLSSFRNSKHGAGSGTVARVNERVPLPGSPVRGSATGRPIMAALDLLGRRWALRILWELRNEPVGARELRDRCDSMSSSVLYDRLRELRRAGIVGQRTDDTYELTPIGRDLQRALEPLLAWSNAWAQAQGDAPAHKSAGSGGS